MAESSAIADQITAALANKGFQVDRTVGQSHFRCNLAVRCDGDATYRLGILVDNDAYYDQSDLLERDMMRPRLLRSFGWNIAVVFAKDWYSDREAVVDRLLRQVDGDSEVEDAEFDDEFDESLAHSPRTELVIPVCNHQGGDEPPAENREKMATNEFTADLTPLQLDASLAADSERELSDTSTDLSAARYFEFVGGNSHKFWEIRQIGNEHTVRFGRIGTNGQTKTKTFEDAESAQKDVQRLIREKLRKGYQEI